MILGNKEPEKYQPLCIWIIHKTELQFSTPYVEKKAEYPTIVITTKQKRIFCLWHHLFPNNAYQYFLFGTSVVRVEEGSVLRGFHALRDWGYIQIRDSSAPALWTQSRTDCAFFGLAWEGKCTCVVSALNCAEAPSSVSREGRAASSMSVWGPCWFMYGWLQLGLSSQTDRACNDRKTQLSKCILDNSSGTS